MRRNLVRRTVFLAVTAVSLYVVFPGLIELWGSIPRLRSVAGVPAAAAVLAALLSRLFSYRLPLPAGAIASTRFARRRRAVETTNV